MRSLWAAGMLLRRFRDERGMVLLIFVIVAATSFLFAAAPRLFNRASEDALRFAVRAAPASERNVALDLITTVEPGPDGGVASVRDLGETMAKDFPTSVAALISRRSLLVTTVRLYVPHPTYYDTRISLRYQDGVTDATRLVAGRWPVALGVPLRRVPIADGSETPPGSSEPVTIEVALSRSEGAEIGVGVGDRVPVTLDDSDYLVTDSRIQVAPIELLVVGLFEPLDPNGEEWSGDSGLVKVSPRGTEDDPIAYATAYVPAATYPSLWRSGLPFHYEWRFQVDAGRLDSVQLPQLREDLRRLGLFSGPADATGASDVTVLTGLPAILDRFTAQLALSETVLSIAAVGPFALAGGAIGMFALLLVRGRRAELALARGRGASGRLVLGAQLWEAILLAGGASLVGLLAAMIVIDARPNPLSPALAVGVGGAATLLLVGASWPMARRPLGQLDREDPPVFRVAPRRLVIEMTIVGVAVAATLLLRQRGLGAVSAGTTTRYDPLLASVPVLAGLAAGIVVLRLYPLPIRVLGWLAAERRDVVPVLGLRTIARHPAAANLPLLVLLLTAAFGAFSSVIASSVDRGQLVASYMDVGGDYRIERLVAGAPLPQLDSGAIPGVSAVAPGVIAESAAYSGSPGERASIYLQAVDPRAYQQVLAGSAVDPQWPMPLLATPSGAAIGTDENPIPAILSPTPPAGSGHRLTGDTVHITVATHVLSFRIVEQRSGFPGVGEGAAFAVVPLNWLQAALSARLVPPSVLWLRGTASAADQLAAVVAALPGSARLVSRYDAYAALHDVPMGKLVATGYGLALIVAAVYMALTVVGGLVLSAARRTRDLAYLRTLGVSTSQALGLTIVEHGPAVVLALVPGVALGIGMAILCEPGLGLASFVGTAGPVSLFVDWPALGLLVAALIGVLAVAVMAGIWISGRERLVDAMRIGED